MNQKENTNEYENCFRSNYENVVKLQEIYNGYQITSILHTAAELKVPEILGTTLDSKASVSQLAMKIGAHEDSLYRLMRALAANGCFVELLDEIGPNGETGYFKHSEISLAMADPYIRDEMIMTGSIAFYRSFETLTQTIKTGIPHTPQALKATNFWEFCKQNPDEQRIFSKGMTALTIRTAPIIASQHDYNRFDTVCDLGGSQGILILEILKQHPNIKQGINFDLPSVLKGLEDEAGKQWKDSRYIDYPGSFLESVPPADCYVMKSIIHDWNDEKSKIILRTIAKSIKPNGEVHIIDYVVDDYIKGNREYVTLLDIHMLHCHGAKERTTKEWEDLVSDTPFKIAAISSTGKLHCQNTIILIKK